MFFFIAHQAKCYPRAPFCLHLKYILFYYLYLLISFSFFSIEYIFERLQPLALYKCFIVFSCVAYENTEIKKLHTHQVVAVFCSRFFFFFGSTLSYRWHLVHCIFTDICWCWGVISVLISLYHWCWKLCQPGFFVT